LAHDLFSFSCPVIIGARRLSIARRLLQLGANAGKSESARRDRRAL